MSPIDYRTITWDHLQQKIYGNRRAVLLALREHGPCTTRALAAAMSWDILAVRPRVTELYQLGFAVLCEDAEQCEMGNAECGMKSGRPSAQDIPHSTQREGIYRALDDHEAMRVFRDRKFSKTNQLTLL